jgi:TatD DNase family protein
MMLIDSHCHLDFPDFTGKVPDVLDRANAAGVMGFITICTHASKFAQVAAVAEANASRSVWCSVGIHPHHAGEEAEKPFTTADIVKLANHPRVVGIGECGLDYFYNHSDKPDQHRCFEMQLEAAKALDLPVIIHTREADDDTIEILGRHPGVRGVLHCFTGTHRLAEAAVAMGYYISFSGILTFKNAEDLRETAKALPADRILVETDSPFLAPIPMRGKSCEPAFTAYTAAKLAELRGVSMDEIAILTTANFHRLFTKAQ